MSGRKGNPFDKWVDAVREKVRVPGSLLVSVLMADLVVPHGGQVWQGSLVKAASLFGLGEMNLRSTLFRMTKDGLFTSIALGRRRDYSFTKEGNFFHHTIAQRIFHDKPLKSWNKNWEMLMIDPARVAEAKGADTESFLRWHSFARIGDGVYLRPIEGAPNARCRHEIGQIGKLFEAQCISDDNRDSFLGVLHGAWRVDEAIAEQKRFIDTYAPLLDILTSAAQPLNEEKAMMARVYLTLAVGRVRLNEPRIPASMRPDGWLGDEVQALAGKIYGLLLEPSEAWIGRNMETTLLGTMPPLSGEIYERFGGIKRPKSAIRRTS